MPVHVFLQSFERIKLGPFLLGSEYTCLCFNARVILACVHLHSLPCRAKTLNTQRKQQKKGKRKTEDINLCSAHHISIFFDNLRVLTFVVTFSFLMSI